MWNWSFPEANLSAYKTFVENVKSVDGNVNLPSKYIGEIPFVHECPRNEHCRNDNDNIAGNCAKGYQGLLCTNCVPGYYSVLSSCMECPKFPILILESCVFVFAFFVACFLLSWRIWKRAKYDPPTRSFVDVIIARVKILLGFYQVIGEIVISVHDINWTGPLLLVGHFISALEINILRLFVRPRCFDVKLDIGPQVQFLVGAISPVVIVLVPFIFYQIKKLYVFIRYSRRVGISYESHFHTLKASLFACVFVLWFVIYPPVCSVIFSMYPISCKTFYLDQKKVYSIKRLRSDYDVDCTGLKMYHIFAYILTVVYVVAFPVALLYLLHKNYARFHMNDMSMNCTPPKNDVPNNLACTVRCGQRSHPTWLIFFCENYKSKFWFWEIVEMARKVTQTLLITLFGWEDRMTIILTTGISVSFLVLHARYQPMKNSYEQGLQVI